MAAGKGDDSNFTGGSCLTSAFTGVRRGVTTGVGVGVVWGLTTAS